MATYYIDSVNGSDGYSAAQAQNSATPWATWGKYLAAATHAAGNQILVRAGSTFVGEQMYVGAGGDPANPVVIDTYDKGNGGVVYFTLDNEHTHQSAFYSYGPSVHLKNLRLINGGTDPLSYSPVLVIGNGSTNNLVEDCIVEDCWGSGIGVDGFGGTEPLNTIFRRCVVKRSSAHGYHCISGADGTRFENCYAEETGLSQGAHGFSSGPSRITSSDSSWSGPVGNVYSRADPIAATFTGRTTQKVIDKSASPWTFLTDAGATSSPGSNQFGVTGGVLYINLGGSNPNTPREIFMSGMDTLNTQWLDCVSVNARAWGGYVYHEGHGFAADDGVDSASFLRCKSVGSEGNGLSLNYADTVLVSGCVFDTPSHLSAAGSFSDWGISGAYIGNLTATNNTFLNCAIGVNASGMRGTNVITNNLFVWTKAYDAATIGVNVSGSVPTGSKNAFYGLGTDNVGATLSDSVTGSDPQLDGRYMPMSPSVRFIGASTSDVDYYGIRFHNPPTLGAVEYFSPARLSWNPLGSSYPYGSFAGRTTPGGDRPYVGRASNWRYGYGHRVYGTFDGKPAFGSTGRSGGPFSRINPYGYGGRLYGTFTGRIPALPIGSGSGSLLGFTTNRPGPTSKDGYLVVGDAGGPSYEYGELKFTGTGLATVLTGRVAATGTGTLRFAGTGDAISLSTGEVPARGSGDVNFTSSSIAKGPMAHASGTGGPSFHTDAASIVTIDATLTDLTLADLRNVIFKTEVIPGFTFEDAIRAMLAVTSGVVSVPPSATGTVAFSDPGAPASVRVSGTVDGTGNRTTTAITK